MGRLADSKPLFSNAASGVLVGLYVVILVGLVTGTAWHLMEVAG